ncbi:hypothetical protein GVX82_02290 [Patescibacteria group bacterium]|jgi:prophage maintenance system killer protein|nr:hypothetical protein [Patescibacteria group bacterium]
MTKGKKTFQPLTSSDICRIYEFLHREGIVSFPLTLDAERKIDALVANVTGSNFGEARYATAEEKVVAYLFFLIKDHPFTDGNKRTAVLTFEIICDMNDLEPRYADFGLDELAVFIERIQEQDHQQVIKMLRALLFTDTHNGVLD